MRSFIFAGRNSIPARLRAVPTAISVSSCWIAWHQRRSEERQSDILTMSAMYTNSRRQWRPWWICPSATGRKNSRRRSNPPEISTAGLAAHDVLRAILAVPADHGPDGFVRAEILGTFDIEQRGKF